MLLHVSSYCFQLESCLATAGGKISHSGWWNEDNTGTFCQIKKESPLAKSSPKHPKMILLLLGFFRMVNSIVRLTPLSLESGLWYEPSHMFLLGKSLWELWLMENISLQPTTSVLSFYSTLIEPMPGSNPMLCEASLDLPRPKLTSAHVFVALIWDFTCSLDHYFYVHLVFPLSLGHKFLGTKFCFPHFLHLSQCWLYTVCTLS